MLWYISVSLGLTGIVGIVPVHSHVVFFVNNGERIIVEGLRIRTKIELCLLLGSTQDECCHLELDTGFDEVSKTKELFHAYVMAQQSTAKLDGGRYLQHQISNERKT